MLEQRYHKSSAEIREGPNGPMIVGYASVFNRESLDLGGFIETIDPGAFAKTLREADVRGLGNHDPNWLLGRTKPGTLRLGVDSKGLFYEIDVNVSDPDGQRALAKVKRGDWDGSSFTFQCIQDQWDWGAVPARRHVVECALVDVGPVTFPAYPDSTAAARALSRVAKQLRKSPELLASALRSGEIRSLLGVDGEPRDRDEEGLEERAVWSTAFKNDLPDSSFLYIEPGGKKDSDGKTTPRALRHFPYKDGSGKVDLPHLRNAISRLSQEATGSDDGEEWLTDSLRQTLLAKAKKILAAQESNSRPGDGESRVGKRISAATAKTLRQVMDSIQSLLDASDETTGGGLMPGESNSLELAPAMRLLAAAVEQRAMPDRGGDADNLAAMSGAVAAAYLTRRAELGLDDTPENGFTLTSVADQDGDADGDGQSLWCVSDSAATWWVVADGDTAQVVAWNGNSWSSAWRALPADGEARVRLAEASVRSRELELLALT